MSEQRRQIAQPNSCHRERHTIGRVFAFDLFAAWLIGSTKPGSSPLGLARLFTPSCEPPALSREADKATRAINRKQGGRFALLLQRQTAKAIRTHPILQ